MNKALKYLIFILVFGFSANQLHAHQEQDEQILASLAHHHQKTIATKFVYKTDIVKEDKDTDATAGRRRRAKCTEVLAVFIPSFELAEANFPATIQNLFVEEVQYVQPAVYFSRRGPPFGC